MPPQGCTCTAACCCLNAFPCLKVLIYTSLLNVRNMWIWCHLVFVSCSAADRNSAIFTSSTSGKRPHTDGTSAPLLALILVVGGPCAFPSGAEGVQMLDFTLGDQSSTFSRDFYWKRYSQYHPDAVINTGHYFLLHTSFPSLVDFVRATDFSSFLS